MKTILIFGGTGFIGRRLVKDLEEEYEIIILSRKPENYNFELHNNVRIEKYDLARPQDLFRTFENAFGIINLSGENIGGGSWNKAIKEKILYSRLAIGNFIKEIFQSLNNKPTFYFHGSATGYYGINPSDAKISETRPSSRDSFLTNVALQSEENVGELSDQTRLVYLRTGIILDRQEGALPKIAMPFRLFAGGPIGNGKQWIPWIHIDDEVSAIRFAIEQAELSGPVNLTAPNPIRQNEFARSMGKVLHRPAFIPTPAFVLKILLGKERATDLLLSGLRVIPDKLLKFGFKFHYEKIDDALNDIYL